MSGDGAEAWLARRLPRRWRRRLLRLNRARWWTKLRILRSYGAAPWRRPWVAAAYVLLDPEVDNFTYELANAHELAPFVGAALGIDRERASALVDEARHDPLLARALRPRLCARLDAKRRLHPGRRLAWYAAVRALAPALVVETGIKDGLGSLLLLRALQRNARDGRPGQLISFDLYPDKGHLVPAELRPLWEPIFASTRTALEPALRGRRVGMLIHDSEPTYAIERFEYDVALRHAADRLVLVSGSSHQSSALRDLAGELGVEWREFRDQPRTHPSPGAATAVIVVEGAGTPA